MMALAAKALVKALVAKVLVLALAANMTPTAALLLAVELVVAMVAVLASRPLDKVASHFLHCPDPRTT